MLRRRTAPPTAAARPLVPRLPRPGIPGLVGLAAACAGLVPVLGPSASASVPGVVGAASSPAGGGWTVTASGTVAAYGGAPDLGEVTSPLNAPVVGMAATRDGGGYWLVAADGGVFSFGDASFHGSLGGTTLNKPIVGIAPTSDNGGYWLAGADGGIFGFGDAPFHGSLGGTPLNKPIVGIAATGDNGGYWLAASDGGVFAFGDAPFHGALTSTSLNQPVVGIAATGDDGGYWLAAGDGGVFAFGDAAFYGAASGSGTGAVAITRTSDGYAVTGGDGTDESFSPSSQLPAATPAVASPSSPPAPGAVSSGAVQTGSSGAVFGVLGAEVGNIPADTRAGIRWATINVRWDQWEPSPGQMNPGFIAEEQGVVQQYQAAGWHVSVDLGLQFAPQWVLDEPNGQLVDQSGHPSGSADFEYSAAVRSAAATYMKSVVSSLPGIASYRVGLSPSGEMLYPEAPSDQWWAFAGSAQGSAAGLPSGVGASPMPGWVPGSPTYRGAPVTPAMTSSWYAWYLGALENAHAWEIDTYRNAGYTGWLQLVMPGSGAMPNVYNARLGDNLADESYDGFHTMNTGAVWWKDLDDLPLSGTLVDISSVGDGSGTSAGATCQAGDASVDYASNPSALDGWSDTRWLSSLAVRHNVPVIGENSGGTPASDLPSIMALVGSCHIRLLQWAWDDQLAAGGANASLAQYVQAMPLAGQ